MEETSPKPRCRRPHRSRNRPHLLLRSLVRFAHSLLLTGRSAPRSLIRRRFTTFALSAARKMWIKSLLLPCGQSSARSLACGSFAVEPLSPQPPRTAPPKPSPRAHSVRYLAPCGRPPLLVKTSTKNTRSLVSSALVRGTITGALRSRTAPPKPSLAPLARPSSTRRARSPEPCVRAANTGRQDRHRPAGGRRAKTAGYSSRTALTWPSWPGREVTRASPSLVSINAPLVTMFRRT